MRAQLGAKTELEQSLVMGTNGSSIVSKRSVEQLYYPEPHFIRYFVKKRQRRSPLINRGYWLRMYAIEHSVRLFMEEPSNCQKLVLNFGCGFDPLPFQFLTRENSLCESVRFIDVDYHKLMLEKRNIIRQTNALNGVIPDVEYPAEDGMVLIRSKQYTGLGCDLGELSGLERVLRSELGSTTQFSILCTAEVSLTYMDVKSADALLQWASKLSNEDTRFCLLEQYFPDGPEHPFANTMMNHFRKLRTPLYSIHEYPSLRQQEERFIRVGWKHAKARSLWALWSDSQFLNEERRRSLDKFEVFDEWEEFALFASHYFLLVAWTKSAETGSDFRDAMEETDDHSLDLKLDAQCPSRFNGQRRFGSIVPVDGNMVGVHGGLGPQTRLPSTQLYSKFEINHPIRGIPPTTIGARMCHSSTILGDGCLLAGGRTSPAMPLGDCWLKSGSKWDQVDSLPIPCFRHSTAAVDLGEDGKFVLLCGGKSETGDILEQFFIWSKSEGWNKMTVIGPTPRPRFGPLFVSIDDQSGIMCGGMSQGGLVLNDFWTWRVSKSDDGVLLLMFNDLTKKLSAATSLFKWLGRFGSTTNLMDAKIVVAGGITIDGCIPQKYEIILLNVDGLRFLMQDLPSHGPLLLVPAGLEAGFNGPRPLLIGHSSLVVDEHKVLIAGGGAVCFSFGTYWNRGTWLLQDATSNTSNEWDLVEPAVNSEQIPVSSTTGALLPVLTTAVPLVIIPRVKIRAPQEFRTVVDKSRPVILEGLNIGRCVELWAKEYLQNAVGHDRKVVVHDSRSEHMDFQTKNFSYIVKEFGTFLDEVYAGSRQYLRAISADKPSEQPANFHMDFPGLKDDFHLPPELSLVTENAHSSPLRISGPVILWLHYDVLANVLCQVRGEKKLILYPPWDVSKLGFAAGASSSSINVFQKTTNNQPASPPGTTPHEALLKPGDILFLPPLWLHTACPTKGVSVAVNVFFRNLAQGYAVGRDVYGNRDLHAYEKGRRDVEKIVRSFNRLPCDIARFYIDRLADELRERATT
ncbi:tRNA methyltransferase ppm2 [Emydomyces testavorans]|uniref:tRNA wybutosine-synthesizing protein 4 n=1 Tax=Emydomyces testavorans TaxID=2070801 RepID=A0AAF0IKG7_9EURO|nr:tRNA methyltransferase ppm2 [Emydomyces testavorans]